MGVLVHGEGSVYFDSYLDRWKCSFFYFDETAQKRRRKVLSAISKEDVVLKSNEFKNRLLTQQVVRVQEPSQDLLNELAMMKKLLAELLNKGGKVQSNLTYGEVCKEYMEYWNSKPRTDVTKRDKAYVFKNYIIPHFGKLRIGDVTRVDVQEFITNFEFYDDGSKRSGSTIKKTFTNLKSVFKYAVEQEYITKTPMFEVEAPEGEIASRESKFFDRQTLVEVLKDLKTHPKYFMLAKILLGTGIRPQELLALQWSNINMEKRTLKITNAIVTKFNDKAYPKYIFEIGKTKTKESVRTIYLGDVVIDTFKKWRKYQEDNGINEKAIKKHNEDFILLDKNGSIQLYHSLHNNFIRHIKVNGTYKHHANFYKFRHCYSTYNHSVGVDPLIISRSMGHTGNTLTERIYTNNVASDFIIGAEKYNKFLEELLDDVHEN